MSTCVKCKKEIPGESIFCLHCGKKQVVGEKKKTKKRANGSGTVYKVQGRRRKPWAAVATRYVNSIRDSVFLGYFATEKEADAALASVDIKNISAEFNSTLGDIYKIWSRIHFQDVSHSSIEGYENAWKHLEPCQKKKMRDIRTDDFQFIIDNLVKKAEAAPRVTKYAYWQTN